MYPDNKGTYIRLHSFIHLLAPLPPPQKKQNSNLHRYKHLELNENKTGIVRITRNIEERSRNHSCCEMKRYSTFWVCVCSLSYTTLNAHAQYYTAICGLSDCTVFFHII